MREDLAALTAESVAALANLGLVKRALREIERGDGPQLAEEADGTVVGGFPDGAIARLAPGVPLKATQCSCGAPAACRHKVAVALAYRAWVEAATEVAPATTAVEETAPAWSPGEIDDEALRAALGKRAFDAARGLRRRGIVVDVRHGATPTAALPSCSVRFLVPRDLGYALCDCEEGHHCVHVAVAVWAFRMSDRDQLVHLCDAADAPDAGPLAPAAALARELLVTGAAAASAALAQRFALAREALVRAGHAWPTLLLEELEAALASYRSRSARYAPETAARLLVELEGRARAVRGGELPAGHVLGQGEALETRLDLLRLVALGARVDGAAGWRRARVLLCDPDTATVLVLEKAWTFGADEAMPDGAGLAGRSIGGGLRLGSVARGQLVSRAARRRANRTVAFGARLGGATSVTPQSGDWGALPAPLRAADVAGLVAVHGARPPRMLRPRVLAEDVHVLPIAAVLDVAWDPAAQTLVAEVADGAGGQYRVARSYLSAAPGAIDAVAGALTGLHGVPRFVAGEVRRHLGRLEVDPTAFACDRVVVPDLEPDGDRVPVPVGGGALDGGPLEAALARAARLLEDAAHVGLRELGAGWPEDARAVGAGLVDVGLEATGARLRALAQHVAAARIGGEAAGWHTAAEAWLDAMTRVEVGREQL